MQCGAPEDIPKGKVKVIETSTLYLGGTAGGAREDLGVWYPENSVAEYTCEPGYRLRTSHAPHTPHVAHRIPCHRGEWEGEVPVCGKMEVYYPVS